MFSAQIKKIKYFWYSMPLALHLALGTFMVSMLTMLMLSIFLKYVVISSMNEEYQVDLNNHLSEMRQLLLSRYSNDTPDSYRFSDEWIKAELENWPFYTRLISGRGQVLGETEHMPLSVKQISFAIPADKERAKFKAAKGRHYLLVQESVYSGVNNAGEIQVVMDLRKEDRSIHKMNDAFLAGIIFGGIMTVILTLLLSRRTLKPVERMKREIASVGVNSLEKRLKKTPWPRELKPIAAAFDNLLDELEDNFKRLSQFSSDLAHELRTPIHKLMVESDVTLSGPENIKEYRKALENLQDGVHTTATMLEDMLFIARAENKVSVVKPEAFDAAEEIGKIAEFYDILLEEKSVKFEVSVSGQVNADRAMFKRAISNVISNALRFSPAGGVIKICGAQTKNVFEISISDQGPGIAPENLPLIFDRFFKGDSSRLQGAQSGNGLGLSIVKSIMMLHNGNVFAENGHKGGAVFTLIFPK